MEKELLKVFQNFQKIILRDFEHFIKHHTDYFDFKRSNILFDNLQIMITLEVKTKNNTSWNLVIIYEKEEEIFICHSEEFHKEDEQIFTISELKENNFEKMRTFVNDFFEYSYENALPNNQIELKKRK